MTERGLVVARFKRHTLVESDARKRYLCQLRKRSLRPVVGDEVRWRRDGPETGTVETLEPRSSALRRIDSRGRPETVAANLSQLLIVLAASPTPDWFLLDRYLTAGELAGLGVRVLFNKSDLVPSPPRELEVYAGLGYPVTAISALEGTGLSRLTAATTGERSAVIGQSGVGKSTLLNTLMGDSLQKVRPLSEKAGQGRHTTTTAVLHRLSGGGEIIDSPGVRDYAPHISDSRRVERGFREVFAASPGCRFDDCRHLVEPGCAVRGALASGAITARRYESYRRLYELTENLQTGPG